MKKLILLLMCSTHSLCLASPLDDSLAAATASEKSESWLDARNDLTRALAWDRLSPTLSVQGRSQLQKRWDDADTRWRASLPPPVPELPPVKKRVRRAEAPRDSGSSIDSVDVHEIMGKAEAAQSSGRLETALRLFRAAASYPGGEEAGKKAADIEAELGDQAGR